MHIVNLFFVKWFIVITTHSLTLASSKSADIFHHRTRLGNIDGLKFTSRNSTVYQFRRIPYAKPPIFQLRFKKPEPFGRWKTTLNATEYGPNCMQYIYDNDKPLIPNLKTSEDCLVVNVIAPNNLRNVSKRPVFVWIHGGSFTNGQGMMIDGSFFAATGDVVLVTINYRLNIFGFVNVGKDSSRNLGLWDQKLAIQWVKDNIDEYGGDPHTIIIFGESAGGVSVGLQAIIPTNKGLFQRAIAQSGSWLSLRDIGTDSETLTREIGRNVSCSGCQIGTSSCLDCLRNVSATNLLKAFGNGVKHLNKGFSMKSVIGPVVDGDLIPLEPLRMLQDPSSSASAMFNSIDYMAGSNDGEAGLFYFSLISQQTKFYFDIKKGIPSSVVCNHIVPYVTGEVLGGCNSISDAICKKYSKMDANDSLSEQTQLAMNFLADMEMSSLAAKTLDFHSRSQKNSYQYLFTHQPTWGLINNRPSWLLGANHADELAFIFGLTIWYPTNIPISSTESELSSRMRMYWQNFGKSGDPNPNGTHEWPLYDPDYSKSSFMRIGEYRNATVDNLQDRMKFWNVEISQLISQCSNHGNCLTMDSTMGYIIAFLAMIGKLCQSL